MRAMYYERFGERPTIEQLPDPSPSPDGVVIEVGASGVCRSDWHGWMGHDPDIVLPHVPGHELAGVIVAVGSDVVDWRRGDRVTVPFVGGCGRCDVCAAGDHQVCPQQFQPGFTHWGSFASFVAIGYADTNLVALPDDLGFVEAAALGCRVATAYRAVVERARVRPGEWLVVHGCGGVGLSALMVGRALGARTVAVDVHHAALDAARLAGAEVVIDAAGSPPGEVASMIADATAGGAHASIDAVGGAATSLASILGLRRRGRHVQVGLMTGDAASAPLPFGRVIAWELDVFGSHGMSAQSYPAMLSMIADGELPVDRLVRRTVTLDAAVDHLVAPDSTGAGITVIDRF
ncbi:MAG: zinc-dependent alcohol dehydrogenase family protein [Ilumatobacter sp.]|uniref:zinc-dependent alcohol dehydrogenase family protein n=1 Tax=Ilumatobacter sp. TaxID=1967498 RepID=UPI003C72FD59